MPAHYTNNGVRTFVKVAVKLCRFYLRHKSAIDAEVGNSVITAMAALTLACDALLALNDPGPA